MNWENIFLIGKNGMNPFGILPMPQNVGPRGPEKISQEFVDNSHFG